MSGLNGGNDKLERVPATGYYRYSGSAALFTLVTPAANTKGILVIAAYVAHAAAGAQSRVMAKSAAPGSFGDTAAKTLAGVFQGYSNGGGCGFPVFLPPGEGLYEQTDSAGSSSVCSVVYKVL